MDEKKVKITVIAALIFSALVIYIVGSSYIYTMHKKTFAVKVQNTLSAYGPAIEDVYINGLYVGVYVNSEMWNNTADSEKETWQKEVVSLIRMDAVDSELITHGDITVSFFTDLRSTESAARYRIKE